MTDAVDVVLDGRTYSLRPNFTFITRAEERLGRSLIATMASLENVDEFRLERVAIILHEALRANDHDMEYEAVGEAIVRTGYMSCIGPAAKLIANAVTAGPEKPAPAGDSKSGKAKKR